MPGAHEFVEFSLISLTGILFRPITLSQKPINSSRLTENIPSQWLMILSFTI